MKQTALFKKVLYKARHCGIKENDLIFSNFLHKIPLSQEELRTLDHLLNQNDWDTYYAITKAPERNGTLLDKVREFVHKNSFNRMPPLH